MSATTGVVHLAKPSTHPLQWLVVPESSSSRLGYHVRPIPPSVYAVYAVYSENRKINFHMYFHAVMFMDLACTSVTVNVMELLSTNTWLSATQSVGLRVRRFYSSQSAL